MESATSIALAEFYSAVSYLDRLLFAFTEIEKLHITAKGKNQAQKMCHEISLYFGSTFTNFNFDEESFVFETSQFKNQIKFYNNFIETLCKLPISSSSSNGHVVNYTNLIYRNCFELHNYLIENTTLEIQLPKNGLADEVTIQNIKNCEITNSAVPLFFLNEDKIISLTKSNEFKSASLSFLEIKREEKYHDFLHKGHLSMAQKKYEEANSNFSKARNYMETAEVLTLIAWSFSMLNSPELAKSYCMKAIQKDSQYGPAYNDFGNYLLNEGSVKESLRWFELAKRALNYQNREYPYINAGRAYILLKDYEAGLKEFSLALTIAPHHEELHETVIKLKQNIDKENVRPLNV